MFGMLSGGKINIALEKTNFLHGEIINGRATLDLKKPKKARGVFVNLIAERATMNSKGQNSVQRLFIFTVPLDVEKEYQIGSSEYTFKIQVPEANKIDVEGKVGTALKAIQAFGNMMSPIKWSVEVKLDIAGGIDISKRQQISVT